MKLLLYCTKSKPNLWKPYEYEVFPYDEASWFYFGKQIINLDIKVNGKIVAQCDCEKIERIFINFVPKDLEELNKLQSIIYMTNNKELLEKSCLSVDQIDDYLNGKIGYALYLSNLETFDYPKKLSDFGVKKAPQNMCYKRYPVPFDNELGGWEIDKETIIISIKPEHLKNILNGKKTIEVRKKILKCMEGLMK